MLIFITGGRIAGAFCNIPCQPKHEDLAHKDGGGGSGGANCRRR